MRSEKDPLEREKRLLTEQLHQARLDVETARAAFNMAQEDDLIAACIYEQNAAALRYSNLLKRLRLLERTALEA